MSVNIHFDLVDLKRSGMEYRLEVFEEHDYNDGEEDEPFMRVVPLLVIPAWNVSTQIWTDPCGCSPEVVLGVKNNKHVMEHLADLGVPFRVH